MKKRRPQPRPDAVLKNLPPARQEQIIAWCRKPVDRESGPDGQAKGEPIPRSGGQTYALDQLAADGCKVSPGTLSQFVRWWDLEEDLEASFAVEEQVLQKTGNPQKARAAGETVLIRLGLAKQDPELIALGVKTHDSRRSLDLLEESGKVKASQKAEQLAQGRERLMFDKEKWVTESCEKIMQAARDPKMREIVESEIPNAEKIALIRKAYFADIDAVQVELPE